MSNRQSKDGVRREGVLYWQRVLETHSASGLTVKRFCEDKGLAVWRFYYWRKKLRGAVKSAATDQVLFTQVGEISPSPGQLRIEFSDGIFLHIPDRYDPPQLQQVIALLRGRPC